MPSASQALAKRGVPLSILIVLIALLFALRKRLYRFLGWSTQSKDWPGNVWLDLHREEAIDPDMEIIDPHHHLWDVRQHPKGWPIPLYQIQLFYATTSPSEINKKVLEGMQASAPAAVSSFVGRSLRQEPFCMPYMGEELELDIRNRDCGKRGHNVVKTVYLECGWADTSVEAALRPVGEVRMVEEVHRNFPKLCNGMVANANLKLEDVETTLKAFKEIPLVRGIRHSLSSSKDPAVAGAVPNGEAEADTPEFRRGFALLEKYDLSYDVWMFHEQLPSVTALAKDFPNTTIIIDHVAEPLGIGAYKRETTFPIWEKGMRELAKASKNVFVKLSGLGMCRTGFHLDDRRKPVNSTELAAAFAPYFNVVIDAFGVERCMFASNFPVDRVSYDYTVMWNAFKLIVKDRPAEERKALMYDNAKRVYRL